MEVLDGRNGIFSHTGVHQMKLMNPESTSPLPYPESCRPLLAGGIRPSCVVHWPVTSRQSGRFRSGDVHFLPGPLSLSPSYIPWPCKGPNEPKGLCSNKNKQTNKINFLHEIHCTRDAEVFSLHVQIKFLSALEPPNGTRILLSHR